MTWTEEAPADELRLERHLHASPERVWRAWTSPEQLGAWFGPEGFRTETEAFELRPGGSWRFVLAHPEHGRFDNVVSFTVVEPARRLAYDQANPDGSIQFRVEVTFEPEGDGTRLRWRSTFPSAEALRYVVEQFGAVEGGRQTIARLADHVEAVPRRVGPGRFRVASFSVSADGYGAGPDQSLAQPMGRGGMALHQWVLPTATFQRQHGSGVGASFDQDFADGVQGRQGVRQRLVEPSLHGARGRTVVVGLEIAVQAERGVEPAPERAGDDQGVVRPVEVIGRAIVPGLRLACEGLGVQPALLEDGDLADLALTDRDPAPATGPAMRVPPRAGSGGRPRVRAVRDPLVAATQEVQAAAGTHEGGVEGDVHPTLPIAGSGTREPRLGRRASPAGLLRGTGQSPRRCSTGRSPRGRSRRAQRRAPHRRHRPRRDPWPRTTFES